MVVAERPVVWVGSSRRDLREFPREVRRDIGRALYAAQEGETDPATKAMRWVGGSSVVEIIATIAETRGGRYTQFVSRKRFTCCMRPEEIQKWHCHPEEGHGTDPAAFGGS